MRASELREEAKKSNRQLLSCDTGPVFYAQNFHDSEKVKKWIWEIRIFEGAQNKQFSRKTGADATTCFSVPGRLPLAPIGEFTFPLGELTFHPGEKTFPLGEIQFPSCERTVPLAEPHFT